MEYVANLLVWAALAILLFALYRLVRIESAIFGHSMPLQHYRYLPTLQLLGKALRLPT